MRNWDKTYIFGVIFIEKYARQNSLYMLHLQQVRREYSLFSAVLALILRLPCDFPRLRGGVAEFQNIHQDMTISRIVIAKFHRSSS